MTDSRGSVAFRYEPRALAAPGSLAGDALVGGAAAQLFRAVGATEADTGVDTGRPARIGPDAFAPTSANARAKLEIILAGGGQFVTTGQQPGLFLGPLYTLYKTVTAIQLAAQLERATGRPTMAAFWVAADDHDWDEVGACQVLMTDETLKTLRLDPPEGRSGRSVGETLLSDSILDLAGQLTEFVGTGAAGDDRTAFVETVTEAYRPGETMSTAFVKAMCRVFAQNDVVFLDSSLPAVRMASNDLYREALRRSNDIVSAMAEGRNRVRGAGYRVQLTPPERGLQLFYDDGSARHHVLVTPTGYTDGAGGEWSTDGLISLLKEKPAAFTPAAALRPVLESWLLPVAASVLGPGEMSYWAQLEPLFQTLQVDMPTVEVRDSWVLIEAKVDRLLTKLGVDAFLVEQDHGELKRQVIEAGRPEGVSHALEQLDREISSRFGELESAGDAELPGVRSAVGKARHGLERVLDDLRRVVDRRVSEREITTIGQVQRLLANLAPGGGPQERTVGAATFLAKYGSELVDRLFETAHIAGPKGQD